MNQRTVAVLVHPEREEASVKAVQFMEALNEMGFDFLVFDSDLARLSALVPDALITGLDHLPAEIALVFGGDGTVLRACEWALPLGVPLLGVNLGHVGFLAELEPSDVAQLPAVVAGRCYDVEERTTLKVEVRDRDGNLTWTSPVINEASLEKGARERMISVLVSVDDRPLSRWGCDGVLVSTPTGSTAYGFSAGGPIIWPEVEAMLMVPLAAHALFNRPMVLSPSSTVTLDVPEDSVVGGIVWCDGRRSHEVAPGESVTITSNPQRVRIARLSEQPFTNRLVKKFALPIDGWRKRRDN
ncbi:NAD+ kinase [Tessaracoccus bendigoensis DSM 12906]|uniref:NAD kinase n=1 Tax=Tessaracoccus bendigoensis DSM 12906 TaxID=1123357 RepID=A0A1M6LJ29_9ACTN|nr:NAD kinase [Tessaracoccus bendigoensis]SHJ71177.1 NAD+ kinase [Tessaracoccus bendigoensis DSM 12906]